MQTQVYIEQFASWGSVVLEFKANDEHHGMGCENQNPPPGPVQPRYVFAAYTYENYEGSALVITSEDGRAFDVVEGSHCSCYGLEGQWAPSGHTVVEIEHMAVEAEYGPFREHGEAILDWVGAVIADRDARAA